MLYQLNGKIIIFNFIQNVYFYRIIFLYIFKKREKRTRMLVQHWLWEFKHQIICFNGQVKINYENYAIGGMNKRKRISFPTVLERYVSDLAV